MIAIQESRLLENCRLALERARRRRRSVLLSMSLPISPPEDPLTWLENIPEPPGYSFFWQCPAEHHAIAAVGATAVCSGDGPGRFTEVAAQCERILEDAICDGSVGPLFVGGFAFADETEPGETWEGFPAGHLVLPRMHVAQRGASAELTCNVMIDAAQEACGVVQGLKDAVAWMAATAARHASSSEGTAPVQCEAVATHSLAQWQEAVAATIDDIRAGRLDKLVLARDCSIRSARPFDCARLVRRLRQTYPACRTFWFRAPHGSFLGATPELLAGLDHRTIRTAAVAGSTARGTTPAADRALALRMLRSRKERHEHALVVHALEALLAPLCESLDIAPDPRILQLDNVQHLVTPMTGRAQRPQHILDLVRRLHPSPAVAGYPRDAALETLRRREHIQRGWYAGPIGWMDARHDGEFAVAIRSALVRGARAQLFAGAGIVAESDPDAELEETRLKLQPLLSALGEA